MATQYCPVCGLEMSIVKSGNRVVNADTPDTPTKLYRVLYLGCTNKKCNGRYVEGDPTKSLIEIPLEQPIE